MQILAPKISSAVASTAGSDRRLGIPIISQATKVEVDRVSRRLRLGLHVTDSMTKDKAVARSCTPGAFFSGFGDVDLRPGPQSRGDGAGSTPVCLPHSSRSTGAAAGTAVTAALWASMRQRTKSQPVEG